MVISAPLPGTGAVKRPASSLHDDYASWETAPSMGAPTRTTLNLPFPHYAMIYMDKMGHVNVTESASVREQQGTLFTADVRQRFMEALGTKMGYHRPMIRRPSSFRDTHVGFGYGHTDDWSSFRQVKRRKASAHNPPLDMHFAEPYHEAPEPVEDMAPYSTDMMALEIGDTEKVIAYYESALRHFQQLNCRQVAKAFIKFIEPRKQVKHPYNGGRPPVGSAPGEKGDPEKTKPEWWPSGVVHKEPDHLKKDQRLKLLIHILRKLGKYNITSEKLKEVAHDSKRQIKPQSRLEILDEIFRVRRLEERYERGEVDYNMCAYVVNRDANPKPDKDSDCLSEPEQKLEMDDLDDSDDGLSSTEQVPASLPTPIDHIPMAAPSRSMNMGGDRSGLFPLPESLSFGEQPRQDRSFYSTASDYHDDFSAHNILKTPSTSTMMTPSEQPAAFDYLSQPSFSSTTTEDLSHHRQPTLPVQQPTRHYDAWGPSFQHGLYNPVDYTTSSQAMPQPPLPYPMSVTPSHAHEMAHGLPDIMRPKPTHLDPMDFKGPFRTGSLSHPHLMPPHHGGSA